MAQSLVRSDRPTELPALGRVASRLLEDPGGRADGLGGGEQCPDAGQTLDDPLAELAVGDRIDPGVGERHPAQRHSRIEARLRRELDARCCAADDGESRFAVDASHDGEMVGVGSVLDGGLRAGEPVRLHGRSRARCRPAAARLEQRDRKPGLAVESGREAVGELLRERRQRVADADAAEQRHRREVSADRSRDQAELDRAEVGPGAAEQRRTRPGCPQSRARSDSPACHAASAAGHWRSSSVLIDSSIQTCSSLSSRSTSTPSEARGFGRR